LHALGTRRALIALKTILARRTDITGRANQARITRKPGRPLESLPSFRPGWTGIRNRPLSNTDGDIAVDIQFARHIPDVLLQLLLRLEQIVELSNLFGIDRTTVDRVVVLHPAEKLGRDGRPLHGKEARERQEGHGRHCEDHRMSPVV